MLNGKRERIEHTENNNGTTTVYSTIEVFSNGLLVAKTSEERIIPGGSLYSGDRGSTTLPPLLTDKPSTSLTQQGALNSEQLITEATTTMNNNTGTVAATKVVNVTTSTNKSSNTTSWIMTILKIIGLIVLMVLLYLAWKKWGGTLILKIKKLKAPQPMENE